MQLFDSLCSFQGALRGSRSLSSLRGAVPGSGFQSSSKSRFAEHVVVPYGSTSWFTEVKIYHFISA